MKTATTLQVTLAHPATTTWAATQQTGGPVSAWGWGGAPEKAWGWGGAPEKAWGWGGCSDTEIIA